MKRIVGVVMGMVVAGAVLLAPGPATAEEHEVEVALEDLPPAVLTAVEQATAGGEVREIEKETEAGAVTYEVEFVKAGVEIEMVFSDSGEVLEMETGDDGDDDGEDEEEDEAESEMVVTWDQLPPAVQDAFARMLDGQEAVKFEKESSGGAVEYAVEYMKDGKEMEAAVSSQGILMETEETVDAAVLPDGTLDALMEMYPGAAVKETDLVTIVYYEVELELNGREIEVKVSPNGTIKGGDDDDDDDDDD